MSEKLKRSLVQSARSETLTVAEMRAERPSHCLAQQMCRIAYHRTVGKAMLDALGKRIDAREFIGMGNDQLVFKSRNGKVAKKLFFNTLGSSEPEAHSLSSHYGFLHNQAAPTMGDFYIETQFDVVKMPTIIGNFAVIASQPFIKSKKDFGDISAIWEHNSTEEFVSHQWDLLERTKNLYQKTGMFPDLFGQGNIALVSEGANTDNLRFVDTIPETPEQLKRPMWNDESRTREDAYKVVIGSWVQALAS
jgi:hypothetical protein